MSRDWGVDVVMTLDVVGRGGLWTRVKNIVSRKVRVEP